MERRLFQSFSLSRKDKELDKAYIKRWKLENKEINKVKDKAYYQANNERIRRASRHNALKRNFGITIDDYNTMLLEQGNACRVCLKPEARIDPKNGKVIALAVDHDHDTGKVRGLLCNRCNRAIGFFDENPDLLEQAAKYIRDNR